MKKQMIVAVIFAVMIAVLAGCGSDVKDTAASGGKSGKGELTKGEWIGMLGDTFGYNDPFGDTVSYSDVGSDYAYYQQIQACLEWGVITEQGTFEPDAPVSWEYALQTAVRAVGIDRINGAGLSVSEETLVYFYNSNIANTGEIDLAAVITADDARTALGYAVDFMYDLEPVERFEYTYNESVYEVPADAVTLRGDGSTAVVNDDAVYEVGSILCVEPGATGAAYAIRITAVNGNEVTYEEASVDDVYSELQISGSYDAVILSVEGADLDMIDVSVHEPQSDMLLCRNTGGNYRAVPLGKAGKTGMMIPTGVTVNGNTVHYEVPLGKNKKGKFSIDISNIKVTTDIDYSLFGGLKKADATVSFDDKISASYESDHHSQTIPLGTITLQLGTTPCNVELGLVLNVGFDGKADLTYTSTVVGNMGYKKDCGLSKSVDNQNAAFDFHADATVTVEPTVKADLRLLKTSIANIKVTSGVVAIANVDADLLGNQPLCIDIYLYVPLRWAINEDGCIMTNISDKLKYSQTVWDSENSEINKRFHWEDGVEVGECTRGEDAVETPPVDEDGKPYDEYKIFDFEEIDFGVIRPASTYIVLDEGESLVLGILSVPGGAEVSELVYTVTDSAVCSVSGGVIHAAGNGSTTVKISTQDGKYHTYITVVVNGGYHDTSGFQTL